MSSIVSLIEEMFLLSILHANEVKRVDKHENFRSILTWIADDSFLVR